MADATATRWPDAVLNKMRTKGDPLADDAVAAVLDRAGPLAVNEVMHHLVRVDDPVPDKLPDELQAYLSKTLPLPDWADAHKIERGQRLFEHWGVQISVCLFCASLPSSYAAAKGVKVLYLTAQLDSHARRRVMETGQFLLDVLAVGGLGDNGKGRRVIQRVRLMHAAVRHLITERAKQFPHMWDEEDWGRPLNQEDLGGTLLAFSYVVAEPLHRLGVRVSPEDADAYLHLWNVIGHLMGICDEMMAHNLDEATELVGRIRERHFAASPEGQQLTLALLNLLDELTPGHVFDDTIPPLIRHLIGDDIADKLLVPESRLTREMDLLERIGQWASPLVKPFGRDLLNTLWAFERGGDRAPFDIPDQLARTWELST